MNASLAHPSLLRSESVRVCSHNRKADPPRRHKNKTTNDQNPHHLNKHFCFHFISFFLRVSCQLPKNFFKKIKPAFFTLLLSVLYCGYCLQVNQTKNRRRRRRRRENTHPSENDTTVNEHLNQTTRPQMEVVGGCELVHQKTDEKEEKKKRKADKNHRLMVVRFCLLAVQSTSDR